MTSEIKGIRLSDCPTVEVMTTISVLIGTFDSASKIYSEIINLDDENLSKYRKSAKRIIADLDVSIKDLEAELKVISGKYYDWAHQEGHRKKVDEKVNGTARMRAAKAIANLAWAFITNKPPEKILRRNN